MKKFAVVAFVFAIWVGAASPTLGATTSYMSYLNHRTSFIDAVVGHFDDLDISLDAADYDGIAYDSKQIAGHYAAEIKWHDAHKPLACYKVLWTAVRKDAVYSQKAYAAAAKFWTTFNDTYWDTYEKYTDLSKKQSEVVLAAYDKVTC